MNNNNISTVESLLALDHNAERARKHVDWKRTPIRLTEGARETDPVGRQLAMDRAANAVTAARLRRALDRMVEELAENSDESDEEERPVLHRQTARILQDDASHTQIRRRVRGERTRAQSESRRSVVSSRRGYICDAALVEGYVRPEQSVEDALTRLQGLFPGNDDPTLLEHWRDLEYYLHGAQPLGAKVRDCNTATLAALIRPLTQNRLN